MVGALGGREQALIWKEVYAANLREALKYGSGKQTQNASLFFSVQIYYMFLISKCEWWIQFSRPT